MIKNAVGEISQLLLLCIRLVTRKSLGWFVGFGEWPDLRRRHTETQHKITKCIPCYGGNRW